MTTTRALQCDTLCIHTVSELHHTAFYGVRATVADWCASHECLHPYRVNICWREFAPTLCLQQIQHLQQYTWRAVRVGVGEGRGGGWKVLCYAQLEQTTGHVAQCLAVSLRLWLTHLLRDIPQKIVHSRFQLQVQSMWDQTDNCLDHSWRCLHE